MTKKQTKKDREFKQLQFECQNCDMKIYVNLEDDISHGMLGFLPSKIKCINCGKKKSIKKRIFKTDLKAYQDYPSYLSRICKKTKEIIEQREKERKLESEKEEKIRKEVLITKDENICPYCAGDVEEHMFPWRRHKKCKSCKKIFFFENGFEIGDLK